MVTTALHELGTIDILFCNAGITTHPAGIPLHDLKVEEWDRVMNLNLRGTFLCMRAVLPIMLQRKRGSIIITTSASGVAARIQRHRAAYGASKAGLIGLTKHTAVSYAKEGIRINAIAPGWHSTDSLCLPNYRELEKFYAASNPMGRVAAAREIKGLAVYLASDASSYVTGQVFIEDGGETA
jgi:NAD(P)-dependent dehydrogenase (short-subunit alcohol dehydrogenase family)